jgi:flavodoxin I
MEAAKRGKSLLVYDSVFGNTEKIARAIGNTVNSGGAVEICRVSDYKPELLADVSLVIIGSPTRGFRPTKNIIDLINNMPAGTLKKIRVAAFDTRISTLDIKSKFLSFMVNVFGYAAKPIASRLKKKGGSLIIAPEGFFVNDSQGPLKDGELERAVEWGKQISNRINKF